MLGPGRHIYMIGIGGCGMSGLARMLLGRGAIVSGSDKESSDTTELLQYEGIAVGLDQSRAWLPEECDLVIASAAIKPDHPQMMEAERRGLPTMLYAEALGQCMVGRTGVAIAGTHGKSTTTAMLGSILVDAGLEPTTIVGATCGQLVMGCVGTLDATGAGTGFRLGADVIPAGAMAGRPGLLLAEACEFNRSFHNFRPTIASISSVEADHLDIYGSLDAVVQSFREFAQLLPHAKDGGRLLIAHDGAHRREITAGLECQVDTIGFSPEADWSVAYEVEHRRVRVTHDRRVVAQWTNILPGAHNALNAATALVLGVIVGGDAKILANSLSHFRGVDRRLQFLGTRAVPGGHVRVFDDYGHHPTEIDSTLRALRESEQPEKKNGRLICVFQPHQHSRTRHLMEEFANSFSQADVVIVPHIYFVRDSQEEKQKVTAGDLVDRLRQKGLRAMHLYPFEAIVEHLEELCRPNDVLVVMGAGPVWQVGKAFMGLASTKPARATA
jgi:UDP-N-acetylmuramate--alanine ligase